MNWTTVVDIPPAQWQIKPFERMLFVGSCFAENMGRRFLDDRFQAVVNPYGVMYNPASVFHSVERYLSEHPEPTDLPAVTVLTLGTNRIYRLRSTGRIVDNCEKRPAALFSEESLSVDQCADCLRRTVRLLLDANPSMHILLTVSPIRYRKYGYHGSQLSKSTLLLAADKIVQECSSVTYFPAYEIVLDELRDYRFYATDMLHPSEQAADYIYSRLAETFFSKETRNFLRDWNPIKQALNHRPLNPDSPEYQQFLHDTRQRMQLLLSQYRSDTL